MQTRSSLERTMQVFFNSLKQVEPQNQNFLKEKTKKC